MQHKCRVWHRLSHYHSGNSAICSSYGRRDSSTQQLARGHGDHSSMCSMVYRMVRSHYARKDQCKRAGVVLLPTRKGR